MQTSVWRFIAVALTGFALGALVAVHILRGLHGVGATSLADIRGDAKLTALIAIAAGVLSREGVGPKVNVSVKEDSAS